MLDCVVLRFARLEGLEKAAWRPLDRTLEVLVGRTMKPYIKINAAKDEEYSDLTWQGNTATAASNFTSHAVTDSFLCDEAGNTDVDVELVVALGAFGGEVKFSVYNDVRKVREVGFGDPLIGEGTVHFKRLQRKDGNKELRVPLMRGAGMRQDGELELHGHIVFSSWERQRRVPRQIILGLSPVLEIPILRDHVGTHWGIALQPVPEPEPDRPMAARGTLTTLPDLSEIAAAAAAAEPMPIIAENTVASLTTMPDPSEIAAAADAAADAAGASPKSAAADAADVESSPELDVLTYESTNAMITKGDIPIIAFGPGGVITHTFPEEEFPMFLDKVVVNRILSGEITDPAQEQIAREHMARRGVDMESEFKAPEHLEYRKNNPDPEEEAFRKWWWSALKGRPLSMYTLNHHEVGFTLRTEEEIDAFIKKFCLANPHYALQTQCQTFVKSLHAFCACDALGGLRQKSIDGFLGAVVGWSVLAGVFVAAEILSGPVSVGAIMVLASQKFSKPH